MRYRKSKVITIGEIYLMSSAGLLEIQHQAKIDFSFKGFEMGVAASLSSFGQKVVHLTAVPNDILGEAAIMSMNKRGINTDFVEKNAKPLGVCLPDRQKASNFMALTDIGYESSFEMFLWDNIHWDHVLKDAYCFFWSGSFAKLKGTSYSLPIILEKARDQDILIITDLSLCMSTINCYCDSDRLASLLPFSSVIIAGVDDINGLFCSNFNSDRTGFIKACNLLISHYPNINRIFDKVNSGSQCYGRGWVDGEYIETCTIEIGTILSHEGTGESFTAGLLYILQFHEDIHALNFAIAAYALNHTTIGDHNTATVNQIIDTFQSAQIYSVNSRRYINNKGNHD